METYRPAQLRTAVCLRNSPRGPYRKNSPQATSVCRLEWQCSDEPVLGSGRRTVTMETALPKAPDRECGFNVVLCRWSCIKGCVTLLHNIRPPNLRRSHVHLLTLVTFCLMCSHRTKPVKSQNFTWLIALLNKTTCLKKLQNGVTCYYSCLSLS